MSESFRDEILSHKSRAELQYVVSMYANIDYYDEYKVDVSYLHNIHWKVYYGILSNMIEKKGISVIDEVNVEMYMSEQNEKLQKIYENAGGWQTIADAKDIIEPENIESYYREVVRYSAILKLGQLGFDLSKNWDKFKKLTYQELADVMTASVEDVFTTIDMGEDKVEDIKEGVMDMIIEADKGAMKGLPVTSTLLNNYINGLVLGNITMVAGASGAGKAQPVDTIIPTPNGDVRMGDIKVGDYVFDRLGKPTKVLGVFPQGKIDAYEVELGDGRKTICNDEHLWGTYTGKGFYKVRTLREMLDIGIKKNDGTNRWRIDTNKGVEYGAKKLPIEPYALGALIGDGSLSSKVLSISSVDEDVVKKVSKGIGAVEYRKTSGDNYGWVFHHEPRAYSYSGGYGQTINKVRFQITSEELFKEIPELLTTSANKYIPEIYLQSSKEQRLLLLQGLMDTDGSIEKGNRYNVNYSTVSKRLASDVRELCLSLGYLSTVSAYDRGRENVEYNVSINIPNDKKQELFTLKRKLDIAIEAANTKKRRDYSKITIKSVEKLDKQEEMVCIMVDNPEHLYLTNDFIVTHNTFVTLSQCLPIVIKEKEPILIMCNEEDKAKWQREIITWTINNVLGGDFVKSRFYQGNFTSEEWDLLKQATEWFDDKVASGLINFVNFSTYSMDKSIKLIRKYATQYDIKYYIIDTLKLDNDIGSTVNENSWLQLQQNMVKLYNVIKPTVKNCHVWVTYQLNKSVRSRFLDQSALGMSKNVADVVSTLLLVRNVLENEKKADSGGMDVYKGAQKVILDEEKDYMICFIDKNRQGANNRQIVWRVDKGRNIMKDVGVTTIAQDY